MMASIPNKQLKWQIVFLNLPSLEAEQFMSSMRG
jgi:hypothetical protein